MGNFWPRGLELSDTQSPIDILQVAQEDWATSSSGVLNLIMQAAETESGHHMIIVHAKHVPTNRTAALFSVIHRPNAPYPVTIQPKDNELPNFLKKEFYRPGFADLGSVIGRSAGQTVTNEWVSETPGEFRKRLQAAFNLGTVKCEILSLMSKPPTALAEVSATTPEQQDIPDPNV